MYIFILDLTPGFSGLGTDNCKTRRESFKFWHLVRLILETLRYFYKIEIFSYGAMNEQSFSSLHPSTYNESILFHGLLFLFLLRWTWLRIWCPRIMTFPFGRRLLLFFTRVTGFWPLSLMFGGHISMAGIWSTFVLCEMTIPRPFGWFWSSWLARFICPSRTLWIRRSSWLSRFNCSSRTFWLRWWISTSMRVSMFLSILSMMTTIGKVSWSITMIRSFPILIRSTIWSISFIMFWSVSISVRPTTIMIPLFIPILPMIIPIFSSVIIPIIPISSIITIFMFRVPIRTTMMSLSVSSIVFRTVPWPFPFMFPLVTLTLAAITIITLTAIRLILLLFLPLQLTGPSFASFLLHYSQVLCHQFIITVFPSSFFLLFLFLLSFFQLKKVLLSAWSWIKCLNGIH